MPIFRVTCIATVRKVYEIEAPDEMVAIETAAFNEPEDEIELCNELCCVEEISKDALPTADDVRGLFTEKK